jgi:glutamate-ammonia-ligase adenylyltransferase
MTERLDPVAIRSAGRDDPEALYRWCRIAGTSRATAEALLDDPDPLATLGALEDHLDADPLVDAPSLLAGKRRGQALVAAADLDGLIEVDEVGRRLGALADRVVRAALAEVDPPLAFVVIALGRYGGQELSYGSDLDLAFAYDGGTPEDQQQAEQTARALRDLIGRSGPHRIYEVDLNLRPEGVNGALARSLNGFRTYYELWADPWELQAMIRARIVAGDEATGHGFVLAIAPHVWGAPPSEEAVAQIRHIKRRIETEKLPEGVAAERHLKVGPGGLIDVEFTTQLMQLRTGARGRGTIEALANLRRQRFIDGPDAEALTTAYRSCLRLRNRLWLLGERRYDELPGPGADLDALATSLGQDPDELVAEHLAATAAAREVVRRLFNGDN